MNDPRLHPFRPGVSRTDVPERMNNPFNYVPHPLCVQAAGEVRRHIGAHPEWHTELERGKMFGVLVVRAGDGTVGFLAAYSGLVNGRNDLAYFVPPVYDLLRPGGFFKTEERNIDRINLLVRELQDDESRQQEVRLLKRERRLRSAALQRTLFQHFRLLNAQGESKNVYDLFRESRQSLPPGGTGECAAPKLLQHAFLHRHTPLCMAEFWWGRSPKGEERTDGGFYPACQSKCAPLLRYMLEGMVDF